MSVPDALLEGYEALRHGVGAYWLRVDVVAVAGRDATDYLQGQLSQDLAPLGVGGSAPALLLEPDGKLTALLRVTRTAEDAYVLDTDAGFGGVVSARLEKFKLRTKVDIGQMDWRCVALRGDGVRATDVGIAGGDATAPFELPVDWNGVHGIDVLGPGADALVPTDAVWCDDAAWEALRIESGVPKMAAELDERTIAAEAHLVDRTVSFTKGCYTGQELVARLDARGSRVAKRLCGLVVREGRPQDVVALVGASLWAPDREKPVGRVTSAAWCPGLGSLGALCYLHRAVEVPAALEWGREDGDGGGGAGARRPAEARTLPADRRRARRAVAAGIAPGAP